MRCFVCKKEIKQKDNRHIYFCAKNNNLSLSKDDIRYKQICYDVGIDITKDFMMHHYIILGYSLPDFKNTYNMIYSYTQFLLSYFQIPKRSLKEANRSSKRSLKYKMTCKSRYGVDNVSKVELIKEQKKRTFLSHYGVDNIWKSRDYYMWLSDYMLETYGKKSLPNRFGNMQKYWDGKTDKEKSKHMRPANDAFIKYWENLTDEQKNIIIQKRGKNINFNSAFTSKLETRCCGILNDMCLSYIYQFWINRKSYDFRINNTKLIIEIQGDYWHANPDLYAADDIINYPGGAKKAKEIWGQDEIKRINAERYNYKIIYLWEAEFQNNNDAQLANLIEQRLKDRQVIPNAL